MSRLIAPIDRPFGARHLKGYPMKAPYTGSAPFLGVVISLLFTAHAVAEAPCDPNNTSGLCVDGESCASDAACSTNICDSNDGTCCGDADCSVGTSCTSGAQCSSGTCDLFANTCCGAGGCHDGTPCTS